MKNNLLKYYIAAIYLCTTFIAFAQPNDDDDTGNLEDVDPLPIDNFIWVLVALGLLFVFFKYRAIYKQQISSQE